MHNKGWIKLHRSLLDWEWYKDVPCKVLFIHLLLVANHSDKRHMGSVIKRGQHGTSLGKLAYDTGLSVRSVRTALAKLERTGEVTSVSTSTGTLVTICKYDDYQSFFYDTDKDSDKPPTNERQGSDKRATTNNNEKNENNEIIEEGSRVSRSRSQSSISEETPQPASVFSEHPLFEKRETLVVDVATSILAPLPALPPVKKPKVKDESRFADPSAEYHSHAAVNAKIQEFIRYRREILRKPMSKNAIEKCIAQWKAQGFSAKEVATAIDHAIASDHQGIFPKKGFKGTKENDITTGANLKVEEMDYKGTSHRHYDSIDIDPNQI